MAISDVVSQRDDRTIEPTKAGLEWPRLLMDGCLLALPVMAMVGVYLLPTDVKLGYVLAYRDPTVVTAYVANFVHLEAGHLLANLLGYGLLVPAAYGFSRRSGRRRSFLIAVGVIVLVYPLVLSWLNVQLVRPRIGYGFSGVLLALAGLFTLTLGWAIARETSLGFDRRHAPLLFFGWTAIVLTRGLPVTELTVGGLVLAGGGLIVYGGDVLRSVLARLGSSTGWTVEAEISMVLLGGLAVVLALPYSAFPESVGTGHSITNIYIHFLGFCLGFIAPFVTFQLEAWLDRLGPGGAAGE